MNENSIAAEPLTESSPAQRFVPQKFLPFSQCLETGTFTIDDAGSFAYSPDGNGGQLLSPNRYFLYDFKETYTGHLTFTVDCKTPATLRIISDDGQHTFPLTPGTHNITTAAPTTTRHTRLLATEGSVYVQKSGINLTTPSPQQ